MSKQNKCEGHEPGPFEPMGTTVYCDGSCRQGFPCKKCGAHIEKGGPGSDVDCDRCGQTHNCFGQQIDFPQGQGEDYCGERWEED